MGQGIFVQGPSRLSLNMRLAWLTMTSTCLLDWWKLAEEILCWMPHLLQKSLRAAEAKMLALSLG